MKNKKYFLHRKKIENYNKNLHKSHNDTRADLAIRDLSAFARTWPSETYPHSRGFDQRNDQLISEIKFPIRRPINIRVDLAAENLLSI